jgi:hypothetical protein
VNGSSETDVNTAKKQPQAKKVKANEVGAATTTDFAPGTKVPKYTKITTTNLNSGNPALVYLTTINGQRKKIVMAVPTDSAVDQGLVDKFVERLRGKFPELTDQDIW